MPSSLQTAIGETVRRNFRRKRYFIDHGRSDDGVRAYGNRFRLPTLAHRARYPNRGKGLAGGYAPLVGVFATDQVAQPIADQGYNVMFHTFGAHPGPMCCRHIGTHHSAPRKTGRKIKEAWRATARKTNQRILKSPPRRRGTRSRLVASNRDRSRPRYA
ncbi:MAG: hypothetical protein Ct9H300mP8_04300 [Gammaproteobacteria bacterium]|nr:MAG: hypothetical protein Ct9H300mP8_04300 [Gammaproteobacteria bacterium]